MSSYFISYRRQDAGGHAGRLMDRLASRFGGDRVFMDVQDIRPGQNFSTSIEETLARCTHVLAVVGPRWLDILKQRAAAGENIVPHEISVGLTRGLTVIPVLVGGAQMPSTDDLPQEMAGFARCQAMEIRDNRFDDDCADLVAFLGGATPDASAGASRRTIVAAGLAAAVVLIAGAVYFFTKAPPQPAPEPFSLTGDWIGQFQKPGQPAYRIRLRLAQTGKMLAGSVIYPTGEGPIVESRIEDDGTFTSPPHTRRNSSPSQRPSGFRARSSMGGCSWCPPTRAAWPLAPRRAPRQRRPANGACPACRWARGRFAVQWTKAGRTGAIRCCSSRRRKRPPRG